MLDNKARNLTNIADEISQDEDENNSDVHDMPDNDLRNSTNIDGEISVDEDTNNNGQVDQQRRYGLPRGAKDKVTWDQYRT